MKVEVINTGSELLLGQVMNTHLGFFAEQLLSFGLRISRQETVPDGPVIRESLEAALQRADCVIVTGGLGPTSDDLTRDIAAELFGRELHYDPAIYEKITGYFTRRGYQQIPDTIKRQAMVPEGAVVLENNNGTAPGLILETDEGRAAILLPGPPRELYPMWRESVVPWLENRLADTGQSLKARTWRITGVGESRVQDVLEDKLRLIDADLEIGYCARPGQVDLRLVTSNDAHFSAAHDLIHRLLGEHVYGEGDELMEEVVIKLATEKNRKLATAESCTGGNVAHRLTNVSGSSNVFEFGWVTYANTAKTAELGVAESLLAEHGAVSQPVAEQMAMGALRESGADIAVSLTGIAGPTGGTDEKPVGTVWIAVAQRIQSAQANNDAPQTAETTIEAHRYVFARDRETFKYLASQQALDLVRRALLDAE